MAKYNSHLGLRGRLWRERLGSESTPLGQNARRDWRVLFTAFFLLNLALAAFSFSLYQRIDHGELFLVDRKESVSPSFFNQEKLQMAVAYFEEKRQKFETIRAAPLSPAPGPGPVIMPKEKRE